MKRLLIPALVIAAGLAFTACGDDDSGAGSAVKDQVSSAVGGAKDAVTTAACTALTGVNDKLAAYEAPSAEQVQTFKTEVAPLVNTLESALTALGNKLPGDLGTKFTDASAKVDEAVNEADGSKAAEKLGEAVKGLETQVESVQKSLGC